MDRAEDINNSHLSQLEEDLQQQLTRTEERVREEVSGIPAEFTRQTVSALKRTS